MKTGERDGFPRMIIFGIDPSEFLETVNDRGFSSKGKVDVQWKDRLQTYSLRLDGNSIITIENETKKIIISSGTETKYRVQIDTSFVGGQEKPGEFLKKVFNTVIADGLYPERGQNEEKIKMFKALKDPQT